MSWCSRRIGLLEVPIFSVKCSEVVPSCGGFVDPVNVSNDYFGHPSGEMRVKANPLDPVRRESTLWIPVPLLDRVEDMSLDSNSDLIPCT